MLVLFITAPIALLVHSVTRHTLVASICVSVLATTIVWLVAFDRLGGPATNPAFIHTLVLTIALPFIISWSIGLVFSWVRNFREK
ncbi:MAG: hypothetical protein ACI9ON_001995 [Limisphaerales bacterium]|jgi:hypothetical protein